MSPLKKQRVDDGSSDPASSVLVPPPPSTEKKSDFIGQWDGDLYGGNGVGFEFDVVNEFKEKEDGGAEQRATSKVGTGYGTGGSIS
nr:TPA_asm: hypothetical protein HUJ06_001394 [Nelumbo nucifera]